MSPYARALPARPGGTAPHVIIDNLDAPELSPGDRHHLSRVRRLRDGDLVSITDGRGSWRWCGFGDELEVLGEVVHDPDPIPTLTVAFALVKGERPELVVQKLTELGIDVIVPFLAERSVVRWDDDKSERQADRLRAVAREASTQSRRTRLPLVRAVSTFVDVAALPGAVIADFDGADLDHTHTTVLIGPEGGWSEAERSLLRVTLGPTVLRSETAAIAASTLMASFRYRT
jgi:16S rRNA (uracil1498-N3)-methyltransferase